MFGTIRRHQKWLWLVIITLTVASFVIYFSPYQRMGGGLRGGATANFGSINGVPVTQDRYAAAVRETRLRYFLTHDGRWPDRDPAAKQMGYNEERETYTRLLMLQKLRQFDFQVSPAQVAQLASEIIHSFQKAGVTSPTVFEQRVLWPNGLVLDDFERFLTHELEIQQLVNLIGLSGTLMTSQQAQTLYRYEHEEVKAQAALFPATNYLAQSAVTPEIVAQFFTNRMAEYRVPERVQVSYVRYDLTNYWNAGALALTNSVTNLTEAVEQTYRRLGTNYFADARSPEDAKQRIIHDETFRYALNLARSNANSLVDALLDKEPVRAANLPPLARERGFTVHLTEPFDRDTPPPGLAVHSDFLKTAFGLTAEEPVAGPILGDDGAYVIALQTNLPSYIPVLESIRGQVTADCQRAEAVQWAHRAGEQFYRALTNGLAQARSFTTLCREARIQTVALPPFSRSSRSLGETGVEEQIPLGLLQEVAFKVSPGQVSGFVPLTTGGFILWVEERLPMKEDQMQKDLPNFLAMLRQTAQNEVFNEWFRKQAETGLRDVPLGRGTGAGSASRSE